ncbi:MAG: SpoIIE family protein phosphatase, partial [Bacteroidota bacterium]
KKEFFFKNKRDVNYETVYNGSADSLIHKGIEITESENSTSLKLKYNKNNLSFQIAGINLSDPQSVKYSWVLEGFDLKPTPFGKNDQINYTNLPAGEFILKIFAINGLGLKSEKPLEIKIIIVPPFWKTIWFYALVFITTILALVFYIRIREKKLRLTQEILEKTVKERTSEVVNQKHIIEEKQKEIIDSINYAKRIQYTLLAHDEFLKDNLQEHFVYFNPKDIVSGDFYWATKKQNKFYLAVCDSTGHGVPGAFMSLLSIGFLSEAINEKSILEPNKVLDYVRQKLIDNISKEGQKDGFDGILICIDNKKNIITYAAANNTPVLVSEDNIYKLTADKMPVGIGEREQDFQLHTIDVKKGDLLYLYTDGFADQFGGSKGKKFKYKTLNELLFSNYTKTLLEQKEILEESFKGWRGDLEQVDDVCIIGIRI